MSGLELLLEYLTKYFPILLFIFIALAFGVVTLLSVIWFNRNIRNRKSCPRMSAGPNRFLMPGCRFPVRYYIFAMFFVIFDIEVIFLYPWAVVFNDSTKSSVIGLVEMLIFIALFLVAYVYAWRKGALEWD